MAVSKTTYPAISPDGNLSRYLEQIRSFPMLEPKKNTCSPRRGRSAAMSTPRTAL
jgi:hypothetical protein